MNLALASRGLALAWRSRSTFPRSIPDLCRRTFEIGNSPGRNLAMEGVRGVAVLLVFFAHFSQLFGERFSRDGLSEALAHYPGAVGHTGVDLFFILSGYLIYGAVIRRPIELRRFLLRRVQRIYPAFAAVFLLYLALSAVFPEESKIPPGTGPAAWYLAQNFLLLPGMFDVPAMNSVAWSLSYEFFYYLALPALVLAFGMRRWRPECRVIFFFATALVYLAVWWAVYGLTGTAWPIRFRLVTFVFGIAMHELLRSRPIGKAAHSKREWLASLLFAGALAICYQLNAGGLAGLDPPLRILLEVITVSIGFSAFLIYSTGYRGWLYLALAWTPLRWLGNMSYSYYLIHLAALHGAALVLPRHLPFSAIEPIPYLVAATASFAFTAVAAAVLFVTVERPLSLDAGRNSKLEPMRILRQRFLPAFGRLALLRATADSERPGRP